MSYALVGTIHDERVRHKIESGPMRIGRSGDCEIQLPVASVSREHARIVPEDDRIMVEDLGSRNGTWVNGNRIAGPTSLRPGDRVEIAGVILELVSEQPQAAQTILAGDAAMASSAAIDWKEIYASTQAGSASAYKKLNLFQVLAEAGELLTGQRSLEELYEEILDLVGKTIPSERTFILLTDDDNPEPQVKASRVSQKAEGNEQIMLSRTMLDKVISERTSFLTLDAMHDPRFQAQQSIIIQGTRSAMAAPLFDNENVIGALYADSTDPATRYSKDELRTFTILANLVGVKITQARLAVAEEEKRQLQLELNTAKDILSQILPEDLENVDGYELCAFQEPCLTVGGDLYDTHRLPDGRVACLVADVSGKGLGAALLVSNIMACVRLLTDDFQGPVALVTRLNRQLSQSTDAMRFATLFLGILDPSTGRLEYVNAGHNPPLLITPDGTTHEIDATGLPVGMMEDSEYEAGSVDIDPGSFVALFSDGIPEASKLEDDDDDYGMERLVALLQEERERSAKDIVDRVVEDVSTYLGEAPPSDDITLMLIRRLVV